MKAKLIKNNKIVELVDVKYSTYSDYYPYIDINNGNMYRGCELMFIDETEPKEDFVSIDKVCNYLKHNLSKFGSEQDKTWNENIEIFVNKFKSAMEE